MIATAFDLKGAFNDVTLALMPGANEADVLFRLDQLVEPYGGLGAYGRDTQVSHQLIDSEIQGLSGIAILVPAVFLAIAAFLLNLVLARLVSTQREQIAVLKAFGYSNLAVGFHYLKLVLVITLGGAVLGTVSCIWLGALMTQVYTQYFHFPVLEYRLEPSLLFIAVGVSVVSAVVGTVTAIRQAVSLPPAEAMRPEPPAVYRATLLQSAQGYSDCLPSGSNYRAQLVAAHCANGASYYRHFSGGSDSRDWSLLYRCHQLFGRCAVSPNPGEDVTLSIQSTLSSRARYELTELPGVLSSEPFRSVPARLRFQHKTKLLGITGIEPGSEPPPAR